MEQFFSLTPDRMLGAVEVALGLYISYAVWFVIDRGVWASLPFLVLFQVGFLYVGFMSLLQGRFARRELTGAVTPAPDLA